MNRLFFAQMAAIVTLTLVTVELLPPADAQTTDSAASAPKQVRKAQRKAARANRTAEVKKLEKNGYKPGKDQANYPQDIQNAERKSGQAGHASPASGP
jgi:hypothetical protein